MPATDSYDAVIVAVGHQQFVKAGAKGRTRLWQARIRAL